MKLSEQEVEDRLRRTLTTIAGTPLDEPMAEGTPSPRRRPLAVLAVAAAVTLVVGVAVGLVDRDERVSTVADGGDPDRTFLDYVLTAEEGDLLFRAEQRLLRECMEAAGRPYVEVSPEGDGLDEDWNRLGRTDARMAHRLGYVLPEGPGGRHPVFDTLRTEEERDAWSRALTGEPSSGSGGMTGPSVPVVHPVTGEENGRQSAGGCFGEMNRELYGDQSRYISLSSWVVNDVRNAVEGASVADRRFEEAVGSWSSCMKDRGYDYDEPFEPVHEFNEGDDGGRPTARELAVAAADVECKDVTGLVATYRKLLAEHGREPVARHGALLAEYRSIVDRALAEARMLLATPGPTTTTVGR
ncbi:MAG TPA: hypothetical protein VHF47_07020 [Acidimicrobiales bacterium]|nr:hypothetical protein [Acidimicrobiales bacterium]